MQVGPCIPVGIQLEKAEVGPTFLGQPTWHGSFSLVKLRAHGALDARQEVLPVEARRLGADLGTVRDLVGKVVGTDRDALVPVQTGREVDPLVPPG
jgi:hypothetical protein